MKSLSIVLLSLSLLLVVANHGRTSASGHTIKASVTTSLASMPLAFTENQGQWDEQVLFRANAGGATMWFTKTGVYYQFTRRIDRARQMSTSAPSSIDAAHEDVRHAQLMGTPPLAVGSYRFDREPDSIETMMIKADFVGSNPNPRVAGEGLLEYKCNYFLGNDPTKWRTDVPNYRAIVYEDIYPGIDLKYYGNGRQMEYDFIVSPGADPSQIMVHYEGARSVSVNSAGELVVESEWGEVVEQRPVVYQMFNGDRVSLAGEYVLKGDQAFGFELPDGYEADLPLVIDPTLVYSTYLGGSGEDGGSGIAVDVAGAAYVTGPTWSTDFPAVNPYQTDQPNADVFVTKLSSDGNSLIYSTYLGGNDTDWGIGTAIDNFGCAYVTGHTYSTDFPTVNQYQMDQGTVDVFVTKLSSAGNSLIYSTYIGGNDLDYGRGIVVGTSGAAHVTGSTKSTDFPTENPYQGTYQGGYNDAFVTKLSNSGSSLIYSTYLGGSDRDGGHGIAVDNSGCAYIAGETWSSDFPTVNPYQTDQGGWDAFVTKLSTAGSSLIYSTYLGGSDTDLVSAIAVDTSGCAFVTGLTWSSDFPTVNPYQTDQGGWDAFITKLSTAGNSLIYSTYLGGSSDDGNLLHGGGIIAIDNSGCAYVAGETWSTDFPTVNPYQTDQGTVDVFVTKLSCTGSSLIYSTYLGGSNDDFRGDIAVDASGSAYVTGTTHSTDFPTLNPYQTDQGGPDVFITKLYESCCNHDGIRGDVNYDMAINIADLTYLVDFLFRGGPAPPCTEEGDVNGDGDVNIADLTYLVDYLFRGGQAPPVCP